MRAPVRARAGRAADQARHWIGELTPVVGDPETILDEHGELPRDRRERFLAGFTAAITAETGGLAGKLPGLRATLRITQDRQERAAIREEIHRGTARLAYLRSLPAFTAGDMCSECPLPAAWHATGVTFCLNSGAVLREPCPSWPVWNASIETGIRRFAEAVREYYRIPAPHPAPAPQPLAVIAAGTTVEDLLARLTRIQADHPGAQVRRGKKGSWEIWPATAAQAAGQR
jgi:hypothetical protein